MSKRYKLIFLLMFLSFSLGTSSAQKEAYPYSVDLNYQLGSVLLFQNGSLSPNNVAHTFVLGLNKQTFGTKEWHRTYNYPNYGLSFVYQKNNQAYLGDVYSLMLHYTHFFFKRKLAMKIADGLSFGTNPFALGNNEENVFITSSLSNGFLFSLQWKETDLWKGLGWQAGISFTHYSNGKIKLENKGLNSLFGHIGLNYSFGQEKTPFITEGLKEGLDKKVHYNFVVRGGVNENTSRTGYDKLYTLSLFADKRLSKKSRIQFGCDYFASDFLKHELEASGRGDCSSKRVGVFVGHDLVFNRFSLPIQIGYYVYNPTNYKKAIYQRVGAQYLLNKHLFMSLAVKVHLGSAEALEYGLGLRL